MIQMPDEKSDLKPVVQSEVPNHRENIFTMFYLQGANPHPMSKNFSHKVEFDPRTKRPIMQPIVQRCINHCTEMGYKRFLRVVPFLSSLEADEKYNRGDSE